MGSFVAELAITAVCTMHKELGQDKYLLLCQVISSTTGAGWHGLLGSKGRAASMCPGHHTIINSQASFASALKP